MDSLLSTYALMQPCKAAETAAREDSLVQLLPQQGVQLRHGEQQRAPRCSSKKSPLSTPWGDKPSAPKPSPAKPALCRCASSRLAAAASTELRAEGSAAGSGGRASWKPRFSSNCLRRRTRREADLLTWHHRQPPGLHSLLTLGA